MASSPTQTASPVDPINLVGLARQDKRVLGANVTRVDTDMINLASPCSKRLGLTADIVKKARTVLYYECSELGAPDLSPAAVVAEELTLEELVAQAMAGPGPEAVAAGFQPGPFGPGQPVRLEKVDDILIVDFLTDLPNNFTDFPPGQRMLAATLRQSAGASGISILELHVPACAVADLC